MSLKSVLALAGLALTFTLAVSGSAEAHFAMQKPADALKTNATGDPTGGNQKTTPCGSGTDPSGVVTKVKKGGKLHIKLAETIPHGGHYRVAVSPNKADFKDPATVVQGGDCKSATIQATPVAPVVADGLFKHTQNEIATGKIWETDVTMPTTTCANCTVQIIQFMTPHAPGCFYYHCANIQIVDEDVPEGGIEVGADAGASSSSSSSSSTSSSGATTKPSGDDDDSDDDDNDSTPSRRQKSTPAESGCNAAGGSGESSLVVLGLGVLAAFASRRRRS